MRKGPVHIKSILPTLMADIRLRMKKQQQLKLLADKVIDMLEGYSGAQDEMGRLRRYLRQEHRFTKSQERDIESMWTIYEARKGQGSLWK